VPGNRDDYYTAHASPVQTTARSSSPKSVEVAHV
jgi:hypothetical protein